MERILKIAIVGGESTGKSTLSEQLALHFNTVWVPEYARTYLENLDRGYLYDDLVIMAKIQVESEVQYLKIAKNYLFCDTDLHVFKVWSEYKYGKLDPTIEELLQSISYDGYIITSPDFPWQPDPLREHKEEVWRNYFFEQYKSLIQKKSKPTCIVHGDEVTRLHQAITFLAELEMNS